MNRALAFIAFAISTYCFSQESRPSLYEEILSHPGWKLVSENGISEKFKKQKHNQGALASALFRHTNGKTEIGRVLIQTEIEPTINESYCIINFIDFIYPTGFLKTPEIDVIQLPSPTFIYISGATKTTNCEEKFNSHSYTIVKGGGNISAIKNLDFLIRSPIKGGNRYICNNEPIDPKATLTIKADQTSVNDSPGTISFYLKRQHYLARYELKDGEISISDCQPSFY